LLITIKFRFLMIRKLLKKKSFVNSLIYVGTDVLNKAIPFLLLPILTTYLTTSDYGIVTVFTAFTTLLTVFVGLSAQNAIYVNYFKYSKIRMQIYITNILLLIISSTLIVSLLLLLCYEAVSLWLEIPSLWLFLGIMYVFFQTISSILTILWMLEGKAIALGIYQIANTVSIFSLAILFIVGFKLTWVGQLLAMLIVSSIFSMVSVIILKQKNYFKFILSKKSLRDAIDFGVPLIPHKLGEWLKISADKFLLVALVGSSATGLYAVGYQITSIVMIVSVAIQKAWQPYLFKQLTNISSIYDKLRLVKLTYGIFLLIGIFSIFIYFSAPYIIDYFLDEKFHDAERFIGYLVISNFFASVNHAIIGYVYYTKKTVVLMKITLMTALLHIVVSYILILSNGSIGAAQASSISFFITFLMLGYKVNRLYDMPWLLRKA